ncbi:MAG: 2Fe-2S iron-sulfur cluster-binding protein [Acidobacteriota bacterium]
MSHAPEKTVRLRIDGVEHEVEPGRSVLQVALEKNIHVPYFCYHPYLSVPGNCRQCQVKVGMAQDDGSVRWMPKLQVSCNTRVGDGMVVDTTCDEVQAAQKHNMEFLLINHPLDCPICDQVGECWLQEHAFTSGPGKTRFREEKTHFDKHVDIGPHVVLDKERCIQCTRCIRFCDEVTGTSELALFARNDRSEIDIFPGRPLDNAYSGNVVDICPVGALTLKEFRFRSRLWFLKSQRSVCPGCARGCNIKVWHRDGGVARITPVDNPDVNRTWICDEGRLIGDALAARERVREPRAASVDGADWERVLDAAARMLTDAPGKVAAVLGASATLEETHVALGLLGRLGGSLRVAVPAHDVGEDDALLLRADRTANRSGVCALLSDAGVAVPLPLEGLMEAARSGEIRTLLVLHEDLFAAGVGEERVADWLTGGPAVIVVAAHESPTTRRAAAVLPSAVFPEIDGTVVNAMGRLQRMRRAYAAPYLARPAVRILSDLAVRAGQEEGAKSEADLFNEIGQRVAVFHGLTFDAIGDAGVAVPGLRAPEAS